MIEPARSTNRSGLEIAYRAWPAQDVARAAVVIAHGASEHGGRYDRVARYLSDSGYACYAIDHQGHGATAKATGPGRLGPEGMQGVLDDLADLVERARDEVPGVPVFLFGHSMGSLIAQALVVRDAPDIAGYVLSGCPGSAPLPPEFREGIDAAIAGGAADQPAALFGPFNEAFEPARTAFDWLSRDPEEVDRYVADPLCGDEMPLTYGFIAQMFGLVEEALSPEGVSKTPPHLPVLLITGEEDPASGRAEGVRLLEKLLRDRGLSVTAKYYPGGRHEMLNETNRDEVQADLRNWLDSIVRARTD